MESPCHICGKPDWCSVSLDGKKTICRRRDNDTGVRKTDQAGGAYWVYERNGSRPGGGAEHKTREESVAPEKADPDTLNEVYGALLDNLSLNQGHRQDLHRRGLSEAEIKRYRYRSLPPRGREGLAGALVERFGPEVCAMVPGLRANKGDSGGWSLAGADGLLVPVRDTEGRIVALKARADDAGDGPKYTYVSSKKYGGPGPGALVHVPLSDGADEKTARLTEGELKADVATARTGVLTVSIPGVSSWRPALPVLRALGRGAVRLAFDADARRNENVAQALSDAFHALEEQGFEVALETWPIENGKGIDDLLQAGHKPNVVAGDAARVAVAEILMEAKGSSRVPKSPVTAEELLSMAFPEPRWTVPGILPEGATILAGKPKMGKSWLALGIAGAVASGGVALGKGRVEQGSVLYLALEDNLRRLQSRLKKHLRGGAPSRNLELVTEWPRLDDGGLEALEAWLTSHPDARLIIIDTLEKVRGKRAGKNPYGEDYEAVKPLLSLAARHNVAVLIVHHLRKQGAEDPLDEVSGSTGLTGGVDGVLVLKRERGRADAYLHVTGRDIEDDQELALQWAKDTATWTIAGEAEEYRMSRERQEIIDCLRSAGEPMGPKEVSEALGKPHNNIKQLLYKMGNDGVIRNIGGGKYVVTDNPGNPDNRDGPSEAAKEPPAVHEEGIPDEGDAAPLVTGVTEVIGGTLRPDNQATLPRLATARNELESIAEELRAAEMVGVDLETTGLNPRSDRVRIISLCTAAGGWLIDCFEVDPTPLFPALARKKLVMHNAQFDLGFLFAMGFELGEGGAVLDTMLMSQVLEDANHKGYREAA